MPDNPPSTPNSPNVPSSASGSSAPGTPNAPGGPNAPVTISTKDSPSTTATAPPAVAPPQAKSPAHPDDRPRKAILGFGSSLILLCFSPCFYFYRQHVKAAEAAKLWPNSLVPAFRFKQSAARTGDIGVYINALGTVTPVYTATITSRVDGQITNVAYREGQMVRKGDLLIEIDPRPYQAALTQAQGTLAKDQAVLNEAKIDLNRFQQAYGRNAIAKQQLDDQGQTVKQDEGTVNRMKEQLRAPQRMSITPGL